MNISKIIGILLIIISLGIGYSGFNKVSDNTANINILGLDIDASNEKGKEQGYIYLGLAVTMLLGGLYTLSKSKK